MGISNVSHFWDLCGRLSLGKCVYCMDASTSQGTVCDMYGESILRKLDINFEESPRCVVRGLWRGDCLELQAKRHTEGHHVQWKLINKRDNTTVLRVKAIMTYKYSLGLSRSTYGRPVSGGWAWRGYGFGFINLFPGSDSYTKYVDLDECIFPGANVSHHIQGPYCTNPQKIQGIVCTEDSCGIKIWTLILQTYSTRVHRPNAWEQPFNLMRDALREKLYMSLVAFPKSDTCRILIHRDGENYTYRRALKPIKDC